MTTEEQIKIVVLGEESVDNLSLSNFFRKQVGKENVYRFLEIKHFLEFIKISEIQKILIFVDIFCFDLNQITDAIGYVRDNHPIPVFCTYLSKNEQLSMWNKLPQNWQGRLAHYYRIFKDDETDLQLNARRVLKMMLWELDVNLTGHPISLTKSSKKQIFISYSREDWDSFVSPLVIYLRNLGFLVWVDQHLIVGGDDWLDKIAEALDASSLLILVLSQKAIDSKYVRMEYRYFFNYDKPIIPLLYSSVKRLPPELLGIQYVECANQNDLKGLEHLSNVIRVNME